MEKWCFFVEDFSTAKKYHFPQFSNENKHSSCLSPILNTFLAHNKQKRNTKKEKKQTMDSLL